MAGNRDAWAQARRSWERLAEWSGQQHRHDADRVGGDRALDVLEDISVVRRLLDHTELDAVRTARRAGRSWAEIATMLGVTRQSAWERWRDLDEEPGESGSRLTSSSAIARLAETVSGQAEALAAPLSRRRLVTVPSFILMPYPVATAALDEIGLVAIGPDSDIPLPDPDDNDYVVTDQRPEAGARVPRGSRVTLWTERRGGSGVREPRRPKVPPVAGRQLRDEQSNEAVG